MTAPASSRILLSAGLLALAAGFAVGQVNVDAPAGGGTAATGPTAPVRPAGTAPASTLPTAESILQQMLSTQGTTSSPAAIAATGPALGADGLLREGQSLEQRSGHLRKNAQTGETEFVFEPGQTPAYPPMTAIPTRRLERMEDVAFAEGRDGSATTFKVDADVTQYMGKNYLIIRSTGVAIAATSTAPARRVGEPVVPAAAPNPPAATPYPQDAMIARAVGRLVRDEKTGMKLFVFDTDGKDMRDPPMGLVPCNLLTEMEKDSEEGAKPLRFVVSGQVMLYRNKNFLYPRTVSIVKDINGGLRNYDPQPTPPPDKNHSMTP